MLAPCSTYTSTGTCGAFLTAANRDPAIFGAACNSSVLTITADLSIHGLGIQCQNPITGAAIGNASLSVVLSVNVTTVLYQNNSVYDVELFWTHRQQSCSVPQYTVMVASATSTDTYMVADTYCNQQFLLIHHRSHVSQPLYSKLVSPIPSLPVGLAGPGYLSSINGPSVSVSLQGLTRGQMYYCKAAATNTNSNNCAGPVVGGVKMFITMTTYNMFSICKSVT
eukprot:Em0006g13a